MERLQAVYEEGSIVPIPFLRAADAAPVALLDDVRTPYLSPGVYVPPLVTFPSPFSTLRWSADISGQNQAIPNSGHLDHVNQCLPEVFVRETLGLLKHRQHVSQADE